MDGRRLYTEEVIDEIIRTVPGGLPEGTLNLRRNSVDCEFDRRTALAEKLEAAAVFYLIERHVEEVPPPSELAKRFQARLMMGFGVMAGN